MSASGMMPPTTMGTVSQPSSSMRRRISVTRRTWAPERMESPTTCTLSSRAGRGNLLGRQPDSLVDDLDTAVAGAQGNLLGAIGVTVKPGLAD